MPLTKAEERLVKLSKKYEAMSGKQGLLYTTSPTPRQKRYVFGSGRTCLSIDEAIKHILALINKEADRQKG